MTVPRRQALPEVLINALTSQVRRLISLPMFHSFVLPYHLLALREGQATYVMPRFDEHDFVQFIRQHQITTIPIVPPIAQRLFGTNTHVHDFSSLKDVVCAGAPMSSATQSRLSKRLSAATRFFQLFGMTEVGWITAFRFPEMEKPGSVGSLLPGIKVK